FRSTLAEALHADLLLHVVDASHPDAIAQVRVVSEVLDELEVPAGRVLGVLNKVDAVTEPAVLGELRTMLPGAVAVSAQTGEGLDLLAARVAERRSETWVRVHIDLPHEHGRPASLVHERGEVIRAEGHGDGWHADASVPLSVLPALSGFVRG